MRRCRSSGGRYVPWPASSATTLERIDSPPGTQNTRTGTTERSSSFSSLSTSWATRAAGGSSWAGSSSTSTWKSGCSRRWRLSQESRSSRSAGEDTEASTSASPTAVRLSSGSAETFTAVPSSRSWSAWVFGRRCIDFEPRTTFVERAYDSPRCASSVLSPVRLQAGRCASEPGPGSVRRGHESAHACRGPGVDGKGATGGIGALVAEQPGDHRGHFLRPGVPTQRDNRLERRATRGAVARTEDESGRLHHVRVDESRTQSIDADALPGVIQRRAANQAEDGVLGGAVGPEQLP